MPQFSTTVLLIRDALRVCPAWVCMLSKSRFPVSFGIYDSYDICFYIIASMETFKCDSPKSPISWRLHWYIHLFFWALCKPILINIQCFPNAPRGSCAWLLYTAFYISFLECCTLPNKVMGTIWWDLSKPPQRIQILITRLWSMSSLTVWLEHGLLWRMSIDIFYILFYYLWYMWTDFWHLHVDWLFVLGLYKGDYLQILNACPFDYTVFALSGKVGIP